MKTEAIWFDENGDPCESNRAVTGEITEFDDDGVSLRRTYVDRRDDVAQLDGEVDYDVDSADVLKYGTWDLYAVVDGEWTLATTLGDLFLALGLQDADLATRRHQIGDFIGLPAWSPAPQQLKDETYAWLEATRPQRSPQIPNKA